MIHRVIVLNRGYRGLNPIECGYEDCKNGHSFGPAVREYWLLHYVVSGFGIFRIDGVTYNVRPGEIFVIPPYVETYYEADENLPWNYIWVQFTSDGELPVQLPPIVNCPEAGTVFESMKLCERLENGRSAYVSGLLWQLMGLILEQGKPQEDYVDRAVHLMNTDYIYGITVGEVADRLGIDRCYFSVVFKKKVGLPPKQYLLKLRMEKAAYLMTAHRETPSIAANSVGYSDLFVFSKAFHRHFGMSPREYIRQNA